MSDGDAAPSSYHHWEYKKPAGRHTNVMKHLKMKYVALVCQCGILRQHISLFCCNTMMSASA